MATKNVKLGIADDESVIKMEFAKPVGGKYKLQFTGAVEAEWDGTKPVTIEIPEDGIKTVNGQKPDEEGNVKIDIPEIPKDHVKTVNGQKPDEEGNVKIDIPECKVKSVNGLEPDEEGNIKIDIPEMPEIPEVPTDYVKTVNGLEPDEEGNIKIDIPEMPEIPNDYVKTINNEKPDENGNIDVEVTSESIKETLGYKPADQTDVDGLKESKVVVSNDEPEDGALWIEPDADEEVILAEIDDKKVSEEMTWSSQKINAMFTEYREELIGDINTALDVILEMQEQYIGGVS